jgi:hypothetical protein
MWRLQCEVGVGEGRGPNVELCLHRLQPRLQQPRQQPVFKMVLSGFTVITGPACKTLAIDMRADVVLGHVFFDVCGNMFTHTRGEYFVASIYDKSRVRPRLPKKVFSQLGQLRGLLISSEHHP